MPMKRNKILKAILRFLAQLAASIVLFLAVNIFMEGVPLIGIPAEDNVVEVTASYPALTDETKTFRSATPRNWNLPSTWPIICATVPLRSPT